jgi:hypothetical protein
MAPLLEANQSLLGATFHTVRGVVCAGAHVPNSVLTLASVTLGSLCRPATKSLELSGAAGAGAAASSAARVARRVAVSSLAPRASLLSASLL